MARMMIKIEIEIFMIVGLVSRSITISGIEGRKEEELKAVVHIPSSVFQVEIRNFSRIFESWERGTRGLTS